VIEERDRSVRRYGAERIRAWVVVLSASGGAASGLLIGVAYRLFQTGQRDLGFAFGALTVLLVVALGTIVALARGLADLLQNRVPDHGSSLTDLNRRLASVQVEVRRLAQLRDAPGLPPQLPDLPDPIVEAEFTSDSDTLT
jgi:hypothetical protein